MPHQVYDAPEPIALLDVAECERGDLGPTEPHPRIAAQIDGSGLVIGWALDYRMGVRLRCRAS